MNSREQGEDAPEAAPLELAQELERIGSEKARLRQLASQLGLKGPAPEQSARPQGPAPALGAPEARDELTSPRDITDGPASARTRRAARRPSVPIQPAHSGGVAARPAAARPLSEALHGFVPAALYEEMKRERDELFFRLTKLEMERSQVERVRRSLDSMQAEVRGLEEEVRRRRGGVEHAAEPLRLSYRRWLTLRRRRPVRFSDYLACRRAERDGG
jgi:hypothetical protein